MASIVQQPFRFAGADPWAQLVLQVQEWACAAGASLRDAVVLLPFAQHLPLARRAWASAGGWMPRIETTMTLARSLAPPAPGEPGQISFDAALDRLTARRLLRTQAWAAGWARRDPRGFEHAVQAVVQTAHALARAAASVCPAERDAYWRRGRELLGVGGGPGGAERLLARLALEWAATAAPPATDALFALRPSAWIAAQAGGPDGLVQQLMAASDAGTPCLLLDADAPLDEPFSPLAAQVDVAIAVCADLEDEAQQTAAHVLTRIAAGEAPVGLIAQDRLLIRRVRALLSRQQVPLQDETGWKLSTTRAAATVAALLRAARRTASSDDWLDWLKSCSAGWPGIVHAEGALQALEANLRKKGWVAPGSVDASQLHERPMALWQAAQQVISSLTAARSHSFAGWLATLRQALETCGAWQALQSDEAGRQVLAALHLAGAQVPVQAHGEAMTLDEFSDWVDGALEDASFVPTPPGEALVVITPLERAMLRPFRSVVMPGADEKRLGATRAPHPLLGDAAAQALGLPSIAMRRDAQTLAFAQLLRLPRITLLRRLDDGGEPLAPSPLLERLRMGMLRAGREARVAIDPRGVQAITPRPVARPRPMAPDRLPHTLSASACEALRACPYRFFALRMLALKEAEELDDEVQKRDYGSWLHAVLQRFHAGRGEPLPPAQEQERLQAIALELQTEMHLEDPSFLPYAASFARLVPRYVEWLHTRDREGARWTAGEREMLAQPAAWHGVQMQGIIDRIDTVPAGHGRLTQLIDYKTGSAQRLRAQVDEPQEDTQLAFYAALVAQQGDAPAAMGALYLPLDEADSIKPIEHKAVAGSAARLLEGLGGELARIRDGAALPALGEGESCTYCQARGLCRRDHWMAAEDAP